MKLIDLKDHLHGHEIRLKKSLSQNFLIDQNIQRKILFAADVQQNDFIVEIGPGAGALTEALLQAKALVLAIEKDKHFAQQLLNKQHENLQIVLADFLTYPLEKELQKKIPPGQKVKVVSNIPYQITSLILGKLLPLGKRIDTITLMVQDEVARRIISPPRSKAFGRISIFCQYYSQPSYLFSVSPNCFFPKPKVHSAVIQLKLFEKRALASLEDEQAFFSMIRQAFQTRRKTLVNALKNKYPPEEILRVFESLHISKMARAEELSLQDFLRFFLHIQIPKKQISAQ